MKEISLPNYIKALPQEEIDQLTVSSFAKVVVIACGIHPQDGSLMLITGTGNIFSIVPNGKMRPMAAEPISGGEYIKVIFYPPYGMHVLSSQSALSLARDEVLNAQLVVNGKSMGTLTSEEED